MAKPRSRTAAAALVCAAMICSVSALAETGNQSYARVKKMIAEKHKDAETGINNFSGRYPRSARTGELRFLHAESADTAAESLKRHRACALLKIQPHSENSMAAACRILYLQSAWKELKTESAAGIKMRGERQNEFLRYHAMASIETGDIESAEIETSRLTQSERDFNNQAAISLINSQLKKIRSGFSRQYIYALRESAVDFRDSDYFPTTLFFLGEFHENRGDPDRAWSAWTDLVKFYPESPEAGYALDKLDALNKQNPSRKGYIPSAKSSKSDREIDIRPETPEEESHGGEYFSLTIGPLPSKSDMKQISRMLKGTSSRKVKSKGGYSLIAGRFDSKEDAYRLKIRIAEEYGINGRIVRVAEKNGKIYVYGE